jgi:hypothetical protein
MHTQTQGRKHELTVIRSVVVEPDIMKKIVILLAMLLLSTSTTAAIKINGQQARNMDDVQSLGVIYINHNFAREQEAEKALNDEADKRGAKYFHTVMMHEPGSNNSLHASAAIYR